MASWDPEWPLLSALFYVSITPEQNIVIFMVTGYLLVSCICLLLLVAYAAFIRNKRESDSKAKRKLKDAKMPQRTEQFWVMFSLSDPLYITHI